MENLTKIFTGIAFRASPFITDILSPQLRLRGLSVNNSNSIKNITLNPPDFFIADALHIQKELSSDQKFEVTNLLSKNSVGIAFCISKDYKQKIELLNIGFTQCIELPAATEVIVKTIENTVKKTKQPTTLLTERRSEYGATKKFSYLYDSSGNPFLMKGNRAMYLNQSEKRILDYLLQHNSIVALSELAFAGWRSFSIKSNTVVSTIKKLRKKLSDTKIPYKIRSIYGYGYTLESVFSDFRGNDEIHRLA